MPGRSKRQKKTGVALLIRIRGHCEPLWAVVPPLQVELSSACSVASLGRFPSHYLPGRLCLRPGVLADHLFGWGIPSTRQAGRETVHNASSVKSLYRAQGGMTLPNEKNKLKSWTRLAARLKVSEARLRALIRMAPWRFSWCGRAQIQAHGPTAGRVSNRKCRNLNGEVSRRCRADSTPKGRNWPRGLASDSGAFQLVRGMRFQGLSQKSSFPGDCRKKNTKLDASVKFCILQESIYFRVLFI